MVFPRFCRHAWAKPGDSFSRTAFPSTLALTVTPPPEPLPPRASAFLEAGAWPEVRLQLQI